MEFTLGDGGRGLHGEKAVKFSNATSDQMLYNDLPFQTSSNNSSGFVSQGLHESGRRPTNNSDEMYAYQTSPPEHMADKFKNIQLEGYKENEAKEDQSMDSEHAE